MPKPITVLTEEDIVPIAQMLDQRITDHVIEVDSRFADFEQRMDQRFVDHMTEIEGYYVARDRERGEELREIRGDLKTIIELLQNLNGSEPNGRG